MLYTMDEVAKLVGMPKASYWKLASNKKLVPRPRIRKGRRYYYDDATMEKVKATVETLKAAGVIRLHQK